MEPLVAMPGAPSSILAPSSKARSPAFFGPNLRVLRTTHLRVIERGHRVKTNTRPTSKITDAHIKQEGPGVLPPSHPSKICRLLAAKIWELHTATLAFYRAKLHTLVESEPISCILH